MSAGTHNAIMVGGSEDERSNLRHMIEAFDVETLKSTPFALFPLTNSDADDVTQELWDLLGTQKGPFGKYIQLMAFKKQHAVLVVSTQQHYIQEIGSWIAKMDVKEGPKERKVWVYHVKNGRASDINRPLQHIIASAGAPLSEADLPVLSVAPSPDLPFVTEETEDGIPLPPTPASIDRRMKDISSDRSPRAIADDTTNSIIVWGNQVELVLVRDALKKLDKPPTFVRIEAVLAEISFDKKDLAFHTSEALRKKLALTPHGETASLNDVIGNGLVTRKSEADILQKLAQHAELRVVSSPHFNTKDGQTAEFRMTDTVFATPVIDDDAMTVKMGQKEGSVDTVLPLHDGETVIYIASPRRDANADKALDGNAKMAETVILLTLHVIEPEKGDMSAANDSLLKMSALSSSLPPNHP